MTMTAKSVVSTLTGDIKKLLESDIENLAYDAKTFSLKYSGENFAISALVQGSPIFSHETIKAIRVACIGDVKNADNYWNYAYRFFIENAHYSGNEARYYADFDSEEKQDFWDSLPSAICFAIDDAANFY
jgi:hypothetical protein